MTLTKERVAGIANGEKCYTHDDVAELARIALASLTAEPAMYTVTFEGEIEEIGGDTQGFKREDCQQYIERLRDEGDRDGYAVMPLYTAPPAPVVPEELLSAMEEVLRISDRDHDAWHKVKAGIVSCRADMLQGAAGNSPAIPDSSADTKRLDWLDAQNKRLNEYYGTSYGWKFDANFQRNAMMLNDSNYPVMNVREAIDEAIAAAPQQEVKS